MSEWIVGPGSLAIFSEADKPCGAMLVLVTGLEEKIEGAFRKQYVTFHYIAQREASPGFNRQRKTDRYNDFTAIEEFGVCFKTQTQDGFLIVLHTNNEMQVTAKYADGKPRRWQGEMAVALGKEMAVLCDHYNLSSARSF